VRFLRIEMTVHHRYPHQHKEETRDSQTNPQNFEEERKPVRRTHIPAWRPIYQLQIRKHAARGAKNDIQANARKKGKRKERNTSDVVRETLRSPVTPKPGKNYCRTGDRATTLAETRAKKGGKRAWNTEKIGHDLTTLRGTKDEITNRPANIINEGAEEKEPMKGKWTSTI